MPAGDLSWSPSRPSRIIVVAVASVLLMAGAWLRIEQLPFHLNVWTTDWLSYYQDQALELRELNLLGYLFRWEGLHPPLSGILHGGLLVLGAGLSTQWAATVGASLGAPLILGMAGWRRFGALAALLTVGWCALAPLQANYGLNTTPYPWLLLFVAGSTAAVLRAAETGSRRHFIAAAILSALSIQVHVLAAAAVGIQAVYLLHQGRGRWRQWDRRCWWWPSCVGVSLLVMGWVAISLTQDEWTFHVAEAARGWTAETAMALETRFGRPETKRSIVSLVVLGIGLGCWKGPRLPIVLLLGQAIATVAALGVFYSLHVADPRLTHYFALPQLLVMTAGAWGWGAAAASVGDSKRLLVIGLATACSLPWLHATLLWNAEKQAFAKEAMATSPGATVASMYEAAGEGDTLIYLWDNRFLNDEPDHLDPLAAQWPVDRLGRPCFDLEMPPHVCYQHEGTRFFFAPSAYTGTDGDQKVPFDQLEEALRRMVNTAHAPGRAQVLVIPEPTPPARPWPMERWLLQHGATVRDLPPNADEPHTGSTEQVDEKPGMGPYRPVLFTLPVGKQIPAPPPMHP
ncbi:MAG TPA: hypothetical protein DIU15_14885 [Deltaproteobacteria bacterium]|nr:hypothetical protein [Deltaproteobacteria bacterium]HCP47325.1 hypothetical protein [Deltaproteobacteria bacterium]